MAILLVLVVLVVVFLCYKMKRKNLYTFKTATPKTSEEQMEGRGVVSTHTCMHTNIDTCSERKWLSLRWRRGHLILVVV